MSDTARLWTAVDAITKPTTARLDRAADREYLDEVCAGIGGVLCRIEDYRAVVRAFGTIPALWSQANWAVFGAEAGDGSGGRTAARERSPADLDMMETLLTIRESLGWQLPGRSVPWRRPGDIPDMMRQFASYVVAHEPQHIEWWAYRFEQWGRLLRNHLNAIEQGPRPVYLRAAACPLCKTRQVIDERDGERRVVPALVVDFVNGLVRAAQCQACGQAWFRGSELNELAATLKQDDEDTPNPALLA